MSFSGSQSAINTALNGLLYVPGENFVGLGNITIQTSDGAATVLDTVNFSYTPADDLLASRTMHPDIAPDPDLPPATRLWAALQNASGGAWGGCVYDVDEIVERLK